MSISRVTAEKFALAINAIRPSWDPPGIRSAFERASIAFRNASDSELLRAAINLAENGQVNTPALLADVGPWWDTAGPANTRPSWVAHRVACGVHPGQPLGDCEQCKADAGPELTPKQIAAEAKRIREELADAAKRKRQQDADLAARQEATP